MTRKVLDFLKIFQWISKVTKMAEGEKRNSIQFGFLWVFKVICKFLRSVCKKESLIIFEKNIKNDFFFVPVKFY